MCLFVAEMRANVQMAVNEVRSRRKLIELLTHTSQRHRQSRTVIPPPSIQQFSFTAFLIHRCERIGVGVRAVVRYDQSGEGGAGKGKAHDEWKVRRIPERGGEWMSTNSVDFEEGGVDVEVNHVEAVGLE